MTFSGFDNITSTGKSLFPQQKINRICAFETVPVDNLKSEIPINNNKSATSNKDNKVNKLVTVFALCPCTWTDLNCFIPRSHSDSQFNFVTGDSFLARKIIVPRNSYTYQLCAWMAKTAPCFAPFGCGSTSC
jgi:hypothetical protein